MEDTIYYFLSNDPELGVELNDFIYIEKQAFIAVENDKNKPFVQFNSKHLGKLYLSLN